MLQRGTGAHSFCFPTSRPIPCFPLFQSSSAHKSSALYVYACFFQGCFLWIWKDLLDKYADGKLAHATRVVEEEKLVLLAEKTKLAAVAAAKEEFFMEEMARMQAEISEARSKMAGMEASNARLEKRISVEERRSRNRKIILICLVIIIVVRSAYPSI
jgi:hypothetical protein